MPIDTEGTETEASNSLRDSLSAAFDEAVEPAEVEQEVREPAAEPVEGETQEQADARARDEAGRFAKAAKKPPEKPVVTVKPVVAKPPTVVKPAVKPVGAPAGEPTAPVVEMKAPQAWRGPAKEVWGQLPEAARVEVLRREKEISTQLTALGEERKYASTMRSAFAPFEAQIRAEGSTPEKAIGNLMNTAMLLRTGPPHLKAQAVADMISSYGVPLDGLVAALEGRQQPAGAPRQAAPSFDPNQLAKQVQEQLLGTLKAQREQALLARYTQETDAFLEGKAVHGLDGNDYGDQIRADMADIIERATNRGSTITLEQAYNRAAQEHPEVSKVFERQVQAAGAAKANASTQRARGAAVSVRSRPAVQPAVGADTRNLRSSLEAAFDANS